MVSRAITFITPMASLMQQYGRAEQIVFRGLWGICAGHGHDHLLYMNSKNCHNPVTTVMVPSRTHSCNEVKPLDMTILRHNGPRSLQYMQHSNCQQLRDFAQSGRRWLYTSARCQENCDSDRSWFCCGNPLRLFVIMCICVCRQALFACPAA